MKKLNNKGFGVVEGLLILLTAGIIGGVGYYVYSQNQEPSPSPSTNKESAPKVNENKLGYTYEIPENWDEIKCSTEDTETNPAYQIVFPNDDKAKDCDDRENIILIGTNPSPAEGEDDFYGKCRTKKEVNNIAEKSEKPGYSTYTCEETLIDNVSTVVTKSSQMDPYPPRNGVYAEFKDYSFVGKNIQNNKRLSFTLHSDEKGKIHYEEELDQIAQSVRFN